ncbi:hypothetical protein ES703_24156 [subsurface metagenome]
MIGKELSAITSSSCFCICSYLKIKVASAANLARAESSSVLRISSKGWIKSSFSPIASFFPLACPNALQTAIRAEIFSDCFRASSRIFLASGASLNSITVAASIRICSLVPLSKVSLLIFNCLSSSASAIASLTGKAGLSAPTPLCWQPITNTNITTATPKRPLLRPATHRYSRFALIPRTLNKPMITHLATIIIPKLHPSQPS